MTIIRSKWVLVLRYSRADLSKFWMITGGQGMEWIWYLTIAVQLSHVVYEGIGILFQNLKEMVLHEMCSPVLVEE